MKLEPGRVFVIPLLGGGHAFGVITFNERKTGIFCDVFDCVSEGPEPPDDLATRPLVLRDRFVGPEFSLEPGDRAGEAWRATAVKLPGSFAPSTRWYLMGGPPPLPYKRKDLLRELPAEPVEASQIDGLLRLSKRGAPFPAAEIEVVVKHLDITPEQLIAAWRAR